MNDILKSIKDTAKHGGNKTFALYRRKDGSVDKFSYEDFLQREKYLHDRLSAFSFEDDRTILSSISHMPDCKRALILLPQSSDEGLFFLLRCLFSGTEVIILEECTKRGTLEAIEKLCPDAVITDSVSFATLVRSFIKEKEIYSKMFSGGNIKSICYINDLPIGESLEAINAFKIPTIYFSFAKGLFSPICYGNINKKGLVSAKPYLQRTVVLSGGKTEGRGELVIKSSKGQYNTGIVGDITSKGVINVLSDLSDCITDTDGRLFSAVEFERKYISIKSITEFAAFPTDGGVSFSLAVVMRKEDGLTPTITKLMVQNRAENLPLNYQPKKIYVISSMPRDGNNRILRSKLTEMDEKGLDQPARQESTPLPDTELCQKLMELYSGICGEAVNNPTAETPLQIDSLQTAELYADIEETFGVDLFNLLNRPESLGELVSSVQNFAYMDYLPHKSLDLKDFPQRIKPLDFVAGIIVSAAVNGIWKTHVIGRENIPEKDGFLICSNHRTVLDPEWIVHGFPKIRRKTVAIVGKSDLVFDKFFKTIIKIRNFIPVDRFFNTTPTVDRCCELLSEGKNVLIFPEGTNYENAETMMPLKNGAAIIARRTGVPILPVRISGIAYTNLQKNAFLPPLGGRITVTFGKAIDVSGLSNKQALDSIKEAIESL